MIWHPFTAQAGERPPCKIVRAQREFLYDSDGRDYVDAIASWWTVIHGHNHPAIVEAITQQLQKLDHVLLAGFSHEPAEKLACELLKKTHGDFSHVFYSDNGSTAVEIMLKLALQFWQNSNQSQRSGIVRFSAAYHGDTFGAMSVSAPSIFTAPFRQKLFPTYTWRYPCHAEDAEFFSEWQEFLEQHGNTLAAIVIEPLIAAAGGMVFQSTIALQKLCHMARAHGVLVLFDEVFTGMGRTGTFCAYQQSKVVPDMLALAKGLTGGVLPLAVTLVSAKIHAAFISEKPEHTFYHGHTMTGNPVGCAAALASLALLAAAEEKNLVSTLEQKMQTLWQKVHARHAEKITRPRVYGAASAADLQSKSEAPGYAFSWSRRLRQRALEYGVVLRPLGNVLYLTPPYNISDSALERVFDAIALLLEEYAV
ncbi:MAG: adenosylmethionine--8-amino-7-oxononanoate transaminase [Turneriella sp.]|nr:adenosylmethionine--8-amino-7-oxononanoate transaminase [Leptospiraceae bacterium]MCX7632162.1 adenosylmethionine--8-amino-7-oxononanoate transaminase [Turneriella sp.]